MIVAACEEYCDRVDQCDVCCRSAYVPSDPHAPTTVATHYTMEEGGCVGLWLLHSLSEAVPLDCVVVLASKLCITHVTLCSRIVQSVVRGPASPGLLVIAAHVRRQPSLHVKVFLCRALLLTVLSSVIVSCVS
jgi:hypothetical protein